MSCRLGREPKRAFEFTISLLAGMASDSSYVGPGACKFFVILNQVASYDDMCEVGGGTCIQALRDEDSCVATEPRLCDDPPNDRVCICTLP